MLIVSIFASCNKNSYRSNDEAILKANATAAKTSDKLTRNYPVEFHLMSLPSDAIFGVWYMNKQTPWKTPDVNTQKWVQGQELQPFYDSTVIYVSHYDPVENGDGGIAYFEDGQIDIHLAKLAEASVVVNGEAVTIQTGTWVLGPKDRIYGVFGEIYSAGSGNYTYTFRPTQREVYLKGKLK